MSRQIYKLCLIRGYTEAYYQLTKEEKNAFWEKLSAEISGAGASMDGPYFDCRWSNDRYLTWFTMKYPDLDSALADSHGAEKVGLFRYLVSETILGLPDTDYVWGVSQGS